MSLAALRKVPPLARSGFVWPFTLCALLLCVSGSIGAQGITLSYVTAPFQPDTESLLLGGLTFVTDEGDFHLTVVWDQEKSPFGFSLWRISLQADKNFLPSSLGTRLAVRTLETRDEVALAYVNPEPDHSYQLILTFDSVSATLGVSVADQHTDELILNGSYQLNDFQGNVLPFRPGAADSLILQVVTDAYTPIGLTWQVAERSAPGENLVAVARLSQQREAFLELTCPAIPLPGSLALAWRNRDSWQPFVDLGACHGERVLPLPTDALPTGFVSLSLLYQMPDGIQPIGQTRTYEVVAGVVTLSAAAPYWEDGTLRGILTVHADGPVTGDLRVYAEVEKFTAGSWQREGTLTLIDTPLKLDAQAVALPFVVEGVVPADTVRMRLHSELDVEEAWLLVGDAREFAVPAQVTRWMTLTSIDLAHDRHRQVIVDRSDGGYRGHTDTVLLAGETILAVYALGHGGATALQRTDDGGRTWSGRLPVPEDWAETSDVPTIHKLVGPDGVERLLVLQTFGPRGISNEQRQAVSEDSGKTWTPFTANGLWSPVSPNTIVPISGGRHLTVFQLDGRIEQSISHDGGLTWERQKTIAVYLGARLTEPAVIASPDGKQLAVLIRENTRKFNSMLIVSHDEGETWTTPVELPAALTGDRHKPVYTLDGRLVVVFRDMAEESPTYGDFVAWVGTFDDLINLREGQYRVRLLENPGPPRDTGYAGLEVLPDGTLVATTYVPLAAGERPSIVSVRFHPDELDRLAAYGQ